MIITQTQAFLAALAVTGAVGARRGWHREVITCAIVLSSVLFLANGGDALVTNLFTHGLSGVGGASAGAADPPGDPPAALSCNAGLQAFISKALFVGMTAVGYRTGYRYGPPPTQTHHRLTGTIPGLINGAAIAFYVSHYVFPGTQVLINTPGAVNTTTFLPEVLGLGLVGLLGVLFVASQAKGKSSK